MLNIDHITNSIFNSRTYILSRDGSDVVWLVDCGDVEPILSLIGNAIIEGVMLTHVHFDHIYGLPLLLEKFQDMTIYTNEWGKKALADARLNMSRYHETPFSVDCQNVKVVREGSHVFDFEVYETPGHNPSCICYANSEVVFTGDAYIPGCKVVTNLPYCNILQAEKSLERISQLVENRTLLAGHTIGIQ